MAKHISVALPYIEPINLSPIAASPLISKCQIKVCYVGDEANRNDSIITKETAIKMAPTLRGCPIVGYYNDETEDFEGHNREMEITDGEIIFKDTTKPYGFVDLNANVWFQTFEDDGVPHEYLMTEGYLWTGQYPEADRIVTVGNNQSMELDSKTLNGCWSKDDKGNNKFFIINEAIISKLCVLGEEVEPCFEGATISQVKFSFDDGFKKACDSLVEQMNKFMLGGNPVENEIIEEVTVEEAVAEENIPANEEPVAETEEVVFEAVEEEVVEEVAEENIVPTYNLEEIPEYVELQSKYAALEELYNENVNSYKALEEQNTELLSFKKGIERQQKQNMIDSFYMLSDAEKEDVIDNIDTYSIDEIEAKLSIICVRNKVSFNLESDKQEEVAPINFNLDSLSLEDDSMPAWVRAVKHVAEGKR